MGADHRGMDRWQNASAYGAGILLGCENFRPGQNPASRNRVPLGLLDRMLGGDPGVHLSFRGLPERLSFPRNLFVDLYRGPKHGTGFSAYIKGLSQEGP